MTLLTVPPEHVRRIRHWFRSQLVCLLAIAAFLILVRSQPPQSYEVEARGNDQIPEKSLGAPAESASTIEDPLPPETELVYLSVRRPNPVAPKGWRRTDQGWEDVSTWRPIARPLGEIVMRQETRESGWTGSALTKLRGVPPLAFAMLQIAAISAIVGVSRRERRKKSMT